MISFHRRREAPPFMAGVPLRDLSGEPWLFATARQALYRYALASGLRRALLPDHAPEGVYAPLRDAGLSIAFYPVPADLRLDPAAVRRAADAHRPDLAVYIHPFGLHLEENPETLRAALPSEALLIEDFALSLPCEAVVPRGDAALYAFPKLLGVAEGGWLRVRPSAPDGDSGPVPPAGGAGMRRPDDAPDRGRELTARLERHLAWQDRVARWRAGTRAQRLLSLAAGRRAEYYPFLTAHYRSLAAPLSGRARSLLERADFEAVTRRRRALADLYLRGLDPRFRLAPQADYLRQALCAFPVRVDDQEKFHAFLVRGGAQGYRLTDRWWFPLRPPSILYRTHYLLPLGHHLGDADVARVIERANAWFSGS